MTAEALADSLRRLGALRSESIQIYIRSLTGPVLAKEIDLEFGRQRARWVREQLTRFGLALERRTPEGLALFALPPARAWTAREADFTWSGATSLSPIHALPDTGAATIDEARRLCREILRQASKLYVEVDLLPIARRTALKSPASVAAGLSLLFHGARREVRAISCRPHLPMLSTVWEAIARRLMNQQDFSYTRLVEAGTLVEDGLAIVRRDVIETGVTLRVADSARITSTFYIADDRAVLQQTGTEAAVIHTDKRRINTFIARFESVVEEALFGRTVASVLQHQADGLVHRARQAQLGERETWWLCRRINYGRFADPPRSWPAGTLTKVERTLVQHGLMTDVGYQSGFPNYALDFDSLRLAVAGESGEDWCTGCWCGADMCDCGSQSA